MKRTWKETDLVMHEDLTLPDEFFELPNTARHRMDYCVYAGETHAGIMVEIQFKPSFDSEDSRRRITKFINFGAIYCGAAKIYRQDRTLLRVEPFKFTGMEK